VPGVAVRLERFGNEIGQKKREETTMSLYDKMMAAFDSRDAAAMLDCYHADYEFVRHQTNTTLSLTEWQPMMEGMMQSDQWKMLSSNCLYENDDILVVHSVMSFPDGSKESVMAVHIKKDGKAVRTETGATPISG